MAGQRGPSPQRAPPGRGPHPSPGRTAGAPGHWAVPQLTPLSPLPMWGKPPREGSAAAPRFWGREPGRGPSSAGSAPPPASPGAPSGGRFEALCPRRPPGSEDLPGCGGQQGPGPPSSPSQFGRKPSSGHRPGSAAPLQCPQARRGLRVGIRAHAAATGQRQEFPGLRPYVGQTLDPEPALTSPRGGGEPPAAGMWLCQESPPPEGPPQAPTTSHYQH